VKTATDSRSSAKKKIWIDLDNSPHVPFFIPITKELERRGYQVILTARDAYQVSELVDFYGVNCKKIGRHYGKNKFLKVIGVCWRAVRLIALMLKERPNLALSHGSRAQILAASLMGISSVAMSDYEHAQSLAFFRPSWIIYPDVIPNEKLGFREDRILKYCGIKEDVYVPSFKPDPTVRKSLGLSKEELVVTIRPPANEAHYHRPESDELFHAAVTYLAMQPGLRLVLLPRNSRQDAHVRQLWPELISSGKMIIPEHVVDGLNLIWFSDLVVSGGGTMNREAAALGIPVYSIFRGKTGAVDRYLADQGRLTLIEKVDDIPSKIILAHRNTLAKHESGDRPALQTIVDYVSAILESKNPMASDKDVLTAASAGQS
jgi:predicted glycosyltransferase